MSYSCSGSQLVGQQPEDLIRVRLLGVRVTQLVECEAERGFDRLPVPRDKLRPLPPRLIVVEYPRRLSRLCLRRLFSSAGD